MPSPAMLYAPGGPSATTHFSSAWPTSSFVDELHREIGNRDRDGHGQPVGEAERALGERRQRGGQRLLRADGVRPEDDRRAEQIQRETRIGVGLLAQQLLELGLLLRVEQPGGRPHRPVLGHPDRVVGVEAVGRDRRRVHEAVGAGAGGRPERVQRSLDVDLADRLAGRGPGDHEREMHDDVRAGERLAERVGVPDVAAPVIQLAPPVLGRVEGAPRDPDDSLDPGIGLEQRDQPEPERSGRTGDGHGQAGVRQARPRDRTDRRSATRTASGSTALTVAPAGVSSVSDSSPLQSLSETRSPSVRCALTISPVTNGDRGCVHVYQLLVTTSISGTGSGMNP